MSSLSCCSLFTRTHNSSASPCARAFRCIQEQRTRGNDLSTCSIQERWWWRRRCSTPYSYVYTSVRRQRARSSCPPGAWSTGQSLARDLRGSRSILFQRGLTTYRYLFFFPLSRVAPHPLRLQVYPIDRAGQDPDFGYFTRKKPAASPLCVLPRKIDFFFFSLSLFSERERVRCSTNTSDV